MVRRLAALVRRAVACESIVIGLAAAVAATALTQELGLIPLARAWLA